MAQSSLRRALLRVLAQAPRVLPLQAVAGTHRHLFQPPILAAAAVNELSKHNTWSRALSLMHPYSTGTSLDDEVQEINTLFVTAREEIEYAKEDSETVYFNESVAEAKKAVDECMSRWTALLDRLGDDERGKLQRSMGLKMEQLKAEYDEVAALHLEDH